jgi:hypothetical protein
LEGFKLVKGDLLSFQLGLVLGLLVGVFVEEWRVVGQQKEAGYYQH